MAVGTVVLTSHNDQGGVRSLVITATASSTDGSFPATKLRSLGINGQLDISGVWLAIATNPGSPAPTDNYDITLVDGDGLDRLNGVGANRDTTNSEREPVTGAAAFTAGEDLTLTIANNLVNSAVVVITLYYSPTASAGGSSSGGGGAVTNAGTFAVQATSVGAATNAASQVTVSNASTDIIAARSGRRGVLLLNKQTVPVYLDPSGGTATTSMFALAPNAAVVLPVTSKVTGITSAAYSASGDLKVHVIELY